MKRYLLFNSNCEMCSKIATELAKELGGWLEIRSLNDPAMRDYLNSSYPNWSWEPMILLHDNEGNSKLITGYRLKLFLVRKLGINKTFKIARLIDQFAAVSPSASHINRQRRTFLQTSIPSFIGAIIALKTPQFLKQNQAVSSMQPQSTQYQDEVGELYHGFVLLPDIDSPAPSYVNRPQTYERSSISFSNEEDLRKAVPFGLYKVSSKYSQLPLLNAQQSRVEDDGATAGATINYGQLAYFSEDLEVDRIISLIVYNKPHYPSPYPIRPVHEFNRETGETDLRVPEKVRVGTAFEILLPSSNGYVAHWIDKGILYTLAVEDSTSKETMMQILDDLLEI